MRGFFGKSAKVLSIDRREGSKWWAGSVFEETEGLPLRAAVLDVNVLAANARNAGPDCVYLYVTFIYVRRSTCQ